MNLLSCCRTVEDAKGRRISDMLKIDFGGIDGLQVANTGFLVFLQISVIVKDSPWQNRFPRAEQRSFLKIQSIHHVMPLKVAERGQRGAKL